MVEDWDHPRDVPTGVKGKGKAVAASKPPPLVENLASPHSLEVLMSDSSLFKELLLKDSG